MVKTKTLLSDYINFDDQNVGISDDELIDKELTFCAVAAVSRLCEDQEKDKDLDECLRQREEFKFIRDLDLISAVYVTASVSKQQEIKSTPPIAWSNRLQIVFLGISCIRDMSDEKLNMNVSAQAADAVGSRFCQGLIDRGQEFIFFSTRRAQIKYMADFYEESCAIVIVVIPMQRARSEATENALSIAVKMLLDRDDRRPLSILLSQADGLEFHRNNKEVLLATLRDVKDQLMSSLRKEVDENFTSFRLERFGDGFVCIPETLEDIVKPFSTHAQINLDGITCAKIS
ncbi:hypothetical protein FLONG3_7936 [Fusarium longipes]|uniref:Uncharacterized protein n=1 Tax=Fusarium longipes TaxID=694270 RepID=A0A395S9I7_9HYPO|nr:hypothetical protein FLONG3_7936 [Fusarium longipes]